MVQIEDIETMGWRKAIKGMRNPMNSWDKMDSILYEIGYLGCDDCPKRWEDCANLLPTNNGCFQIGPNDLDLACRLIKAGPEHRKFLRMIHVQMDITGPLYWWKEMDTYKVATVANSCSTMHRITAKPFVLNDFSHEHLGFDGMTQLEEIIELLNFYRNKFIDGKEWNRMNKKDFWWQMIQLLPSSYNQLRTWDGNMETILSILHQRANHKLDTDWEPFRQACFDNIPYCKEFYEAMYGKEEN